MTKIEMLGSLKEKEAKQVQLLDIVIADFKRNAADYILPDSLVSIAASAARQIAERQSALHEVQAQIKAIEAIE